VNWHKIYERIEYKFLFITGTVLTTSQPGYLHKYTIHIFLIHFSFRGEKKYLKYTTIYNVLINTAVPFETWYMFDKSILDLPRNLQITPKQLIYKLGERIRCSAEGNPEPWYQWTNLINGTVIQGSVLVITVDMVGKDHTFQCKATNEYNGVKHNLSTIVVFAVRNESSMLSYSNFVMALLHYRMQHSSASPRPNFDLKFFTL